MPTVFTSFESWLSNKNWPTENIGRIGDYCFACDRSSQTVLLVRTNGNEHAPTFNVEEKKEFDSKEDAMNTYRQLCSMNITVNEFINGDL